METGSKLNIRRSNTRLLLIIAGIIIFALMAVAGYFIWQYIQLKNNPNEAAQQQTQRIVDKVGKLYAVPTDEQPTVAQIQDKDKLKDQQFFDQARNGDYLVIFAKARKALLYREEDNKLINVGPVNIDDNKQGANPTPAPTPTPTPPSSSTRR